MTFTCKGKGEYVDHRVGHNLRGGGGKTTPCPGCADCKPQSSSDSNSDNNR